jgi:hypothetical protein
MVCYTLSARGRVHAPPRGRRDALLRRVIRWRSRRNASRSSCSISGTLPLLQGGSVVVGRRVLDAEEVVQDRPDVALTVAGLARPDVQDDHASRLSGCLRRSHRERQPVAAAEVDATDDWLERPGEPVRPELGSARVATELCVYPLVAGSLASHAIDEFAHGARRDHLEVQHTASCVSPQVRTRRWAPQRRVPRLRARGVQDRRAS